VRRQSWRPEAASTRSIAVAVVAIRPEADYDAWKRFPRRRSPLHRSVDCRFAKTMAHNNPHWCVVERDKAGPEFTAFAAFVRSEPIRMYRAVATTAWRSMCGPTGSRTRGATAGSLTASEAPRRAGRRPARRDRTVSQRQRVLRRARQSSLRPLRAMSLSRAVLRPGTDTTLGRANHMGETWLADSKRTIFKSPFRSQQVSSHVDQRRLGTASAWRIPPSDIAASLRARTDWAA
jgi:hypothetical protein